MPAALERSFRHEVRSPGGWTRGSAVQLGGDGPNSGRPDTARSLPAQLPPGVAAAAQPDEVFDRYARLVTATLGVPVALVSLVDTGGQVFPGAVGLPEPWQEARCTGLSHSFCQYVVTHDAPLVVTDAREDPRLAGNLAIDDLGVIAYAGFPLHDVDGTPVGSLCAIDTAPREWSERELDVLADLAASAAGEITLRRAALEVALAREAEQSAWARATAISEAIAVGYLVVDAAERVTYANPRAGQVLGRPSRELVGERMGVLFPAAVGSAVEAVYRRVLDTGETTTVDVHHPAPVDAWLEVRATPEGDGVGLYFIDVTVRHTAQAVADRAGAQLSAMARIALSLADAEDVSDLVRTIAEQGLRALAAEGGSVAVPDPADPGVLLSHVTSSYGPGVRSDYARLPLDVALPVCEAARTGRAVLLPDRAASLAHSPEMDAVVTATGSQAWASVPMRAGGRVIGVLTAGWAEAQSFPAAQVELLEAFAAQCAQALRRLQARDAERRAADVERRAADVERRAGDLARLAARRQAALVGIARSLGSTQGEDEVLQVLAGQGAALLGACGSALGLHEAGGTHVRVLVTEGFDADLRRTLQRAPADLPMPVVHTATTGTAHYLADLAATTAVFPGAAALHTAAGVEASASVPLHVRDQLLGALSLTYTEARTFSDDERGLLEAFAALTAQALDRIAAHASEQAALASAAGIAETLQRSMLTAPPQPDHLQIAVRYAAAATHAEVGGDWYDAFITPDGLTTLAIGDVTGHDMAAAAVMGQLRNLVRGVGYTLGEPPAVVLAAVDRAAAGLGISTVATAVVAQVHQDAAHRAAGTRVLRWSNAGHPPPLLLEADGTTRYLDEASDLVLGWDPTVARHDHEVVLGPAATVLMYTDGLIERRGVGLDVGMAWLAGAAAGLAGGTVDDLCDGLLALVGDHLDDDVALLALRAHPEAP